MFRRTLSLVASGFLAAAVLTAAQAKPAPPPSLTGKWIMNLEMSQGAATPALALDQKGEKLTGTYTGRYGAFQVNGTVKDRAVSFFFTMEPDGGDPIRMTFTGEIAAHWQAMKGTATLGELGDASWSAKRDKQ